MIAAVIVRPETVRHRGSVLAAAAGDWPMSAGKAAAIERIVAVEAGEAKVLGAWAVRGVREVDSEGRSRRWIFDLGSDIAPERWGERFASLEWKVGAAWPVKFFAGRHLPSDLDWLAVDVHPVMQECRLGEAVLTLTGGVLHIMIPTTVEVRISVRP